MSSIEGRKFGSYLQPVATPLAGLISTLRRIQHLHHKSLAGSLDALIQQVLNLIKDIGVSKLSELELAFNGLEALM
jgi:hypothetical protein